MQIIVRTFLLLTLLALMSGCQLSKQLQAHRSELDRLAYSEMGNREKFDGLAEVLVTALEEAAALSSNIRTVRYVQKFSNQNDASLRKLSNDLDGWIQGMNSRQRLAFATRALSQPYSRKLIRLVPNISKKAAEGGYNLGALERAFLLFKLKQMVKRNNGE